MLEALMKHIFQLIFISLIPISLAFVSCSNSEQSLTVYSGRSENLIGPILESYERASGVSINVKYGKTAEIAALLLEEGDKTPADIFIAQDAGALGAIESADMFATIPENILSLVAPEFRSKTGQWVGLSGRARTIDRKSVV